VSYDVRLVPEAVRALDRLDDRTRRSITRALRRLAEDPRPPGSRRLSGEVLVDRTRRPAWRIRVGQYRAVYVVLEQRVIVLVVRIAHRREVYRP